MTGTVPFTPSFQLRVLIADDEPAMRLAVERALRGFVVEAPHERGCVGFVTESAASGEEALERITARMPDILFLDYKMPDLSGLDVLDRLATEPRDMLIIMITAYASIETAVLATKRGAHDFLPKPFTPEELKSTLGKATRHLLLSRHARRLAEEKRQVRFQFISVLGHELKTPLNAIEGYLRVLRDGGAAGAWADAEVAIERCLARLAHMRKLIDDLLDMTRIESGQKRRALAPLDLREIAQLSLEAVQSAAAARGITLALHADGPLILTADRGELEIVLNNLISNAVKYNRDGGRVDVTLAADKEQVTIRVADTGIGMTVAETGRLFQEFTRIRNEKTRHILGSGLGLSIVKKVAELYAAQVGVESTPGLGSTFTFVLPRSGAQSCDDTGG